MREQDYGDRAKLNLRVYSNPQWMLSKRTTLSRLRNWPF
jgi:hypothetical protein